jgi:hypothetical protein
MNRNRFALLFLITLAVTVHVGSWQTVLADAGQKTVATQTLLLLQPSTLQRVEPTPTPDARQKQCDRRTLEWERNRVPLALFLGFIIFLISLYLLTSWQFKNTVVRVIISVVAAMLIGPAIMAAIVQDMLKVCINPPGFLGSLAAPLFGWTLGGSAITLLIICGLRYWFMRNKFSQKLPTA